jgi:hypothetical protein
VPLYEYSCEKDGWTVDWHNYVDQRHTHAPVCNTCNEQMKLQISPVRGFVRFPAAGGQEYVSPVTGKAITTQRARVEDLKRTGCRPYEGFESESKEAARFRAHEEKKADVRLHDTVARAYHQLSPEKKKVLNAGA